MGNSAKLFADRCDPGSDIGGNQCPRQDSSTELQLAALDKWRKDDGLEEMSVKSRPHAQLHALQTVSTQPALMKALGGWPDEG